MERKHKVAKVLAKNLKVDHDATSNTFEAGMLRRMLAHQTHGLGELAEISGGAAAALEGNLQDVTAILGPQLLQHRVHGQIIASTRGLHMCVYFKTILFPESLINMFINQNEFSQILSNVFGIHLNSQRF